MIASFFSCREMDDKDFIIDFLKTAKKGNLDDLKEYFSYQLYSKEKLFSKAESLIKDMKDSEIPDKDKIINIIDNGEFQTFKVIIEPRNVQYGIGLIKIDKKRKITTLQSLYR